MKNTILGIIRKTVTILMCLYTDLAFIIFVECDSKFRKNKSKGFIPWADWLLGLPGRVLGGVMAWGVPSLHGVTLTQVPSPTTDIPAQREGQAQPGGVGKKALYSGSHVSLTQPCPDSLRDRTYLSGLTTVRDRVCLVLPRLPLILDAYILLGAGLPVSFEGSKVLFRAIPSHLPQPHTIHFYGLCYYCCGLGSLNPSREIQ